MSLAHLGSHVLFIPKDKECLAEVQARGVNTPAPSAALPNSWLASYQSWGRRRPWIFSNQLLTQTPRAFPEPSRPPQRSLHTLGHLHPGQPLGIYKLILQTAAGGRGIQNMASALLQPSDKSTRSLELGYLKSGGTEYLRAPVSPQP